MSDCATPWTVAHQAPLSMGFSRQEYWSWWTCPPPGDLPNPGIEPAPLMFPAFAGRFFITSTTWEGQLRHRQQNKGTKNSSGEFFFFFFFAGIYKAEWERKINLLSISPKCSEGSQWYNYII